MGFLIHHLSCHIDAIAFSALTLLLIGRQEEHPAHTHTRLTALFPGLHGWAGTRKAIPIWILLKQETVSGSGISWAICKSARSSRQITMPAPHHAGFYRPDALPATQPTASKHWRHRKSIRPVEKMSDGVLVWLSAWSELQIVCIWSSWCHCIPNPQSLASFKSRLVLPLWYQLTHVVLEKRLLNRCSSNSSASYWCCCSASVTVWR